MLNREDGRTLGTVSIGGDALRRRLAVVLCLFLAGCDDGFEPVAPSELRYSIFGYLDASADTQRIRVMPLREVAITAPHSTGIRVTLEEPATGRTIELRDSLFRFDPAVDVGSDGVFVTNFWTPERIQPGATYRFSAGRAGRPPAEAMIRIPERYEVEMLRSQPGVVRDSLRLTGVEHLAFVTFYTYFHDDCGPGVADTTFTSGHLEDGGFTIEVTRPRLPDCGPRYIQKMELLVVVSGAEWPVGNAVAVGRLGVPDVPSNVSKAVGFLGGVLTRRILFEDCLIVSGPPATHCRLRYDAASAGLQGRVTDSICGNRVVSGALVQLTELEPGPDGRRRTRTTRTDLTGRFEITALEPEAPHHLSVSVNGNAGGSTPPYREHSDTLRFSTGERKTYDISLARIGQC